VTTLSILVVAILAVASIAAFVVERRRAARARPVPTGATAPAQLDRLDFERPGAPWLVVLFSSRECEGCAPVSDAVHALESPDVAVDEVEWTARPDLQRKYRIDGVPVVVLADRDGVARATFVGAHEMRGMPAEIRRVVG
jgi:hypothetical protein